MLIERIDPSELAKRTIVYVVADALHTIDFRPLVRTPHCIAVVVADGASARESDLYRLGLTLLAAGAVYFVAAGPSAARMERIFDDAILFGEGVDANDVQVRLSTERSVIVTVSDPDLDEALGFALLDAYPAQDYEGRCDTVLVICQPGPLAARVASALHDLPAFLGRFGMEP